MATKEQFNQMPVWLKNQIISAQKAWNKDLAKKLLSEWAAELNKTKITQGATTASKIETPVKKEETVYLNKNNDFNIGNISQWNLEAEKLDSTMAWMKEQNVKLANEKWDLLRKWWQEESEIIKKNNEAAKSRYTEQQKQLDANKAKAEWRAADRAAWADQIVKRQEWIAARQANMAAWQAWSSWLQMSAWAMQEIKDDIISKYWSNIANAEQFAEQTKMTLDTALNTLDNQTFKDKQAIDNFINTLDASEIEPLVNAVKKATEWNVQALEDVRTYYNTLVQKKAEEEYWRAAEYERIEDTQKQWTSLNERQKWDKLSDDLKNVKIDWVETDISFIMDQYWSNREKFANMSYNEALDLFKKEAKNIMNMNNEWLIQYMTNKASAEAAWKPFTKNEAYERMIKESWRAMDQSNKTWELKAEKRWWTWTNITETVPSTTQIKQLDLKNQTVIDDKIAKLGKDKVIKTLKDSLLSWKLKQVDYDRTINYINTK